jgi:hypothetical protein
VRSPRKSPDGFSPVDAGGNAGTHVFPVENTRPGRIFNNKLVGVGLPYCPPALPMTTKGNSAPKRVWT